MRVRLELRDLLLASWPVDPAAAARALPSGLEPTSVDGECLVSIVTGRIAGGRAGPLPVVPFSQLNVRLYVEHEGEPAVFFVRTFVTAGGLPGFFLGAPYRVAWVRVREGNARAPLLGVSLRYELGAGEATPGLLGRHDVGLFEERGLRRFRVERGPAQWQQATLVEPPRLDLLSALGFDVSGGEARLVYAPETSFEVEGRPRRIG